MVTTRRTTAEYLDQVSDSILNHYHCPEPIAVGELKALIARYPDLARGFLPAQPWRKQMGISDFACKEVPPFPVEFRERLIATVAADDDFRAALATLIGGAA